MSHAFAHFPIHPLEHYNEGPLLGFHTQGLVAPDFYKLLPSHLGARKQISSQESKSYIGLGTHISNTRAPFQITSNGYALVICNHGPPSPEGGQEFSRVFTF